MASLVSPKTKSQLICRVVVLGVALNGLIFIAGTLIDQFSVHAGRIHIRVSDDAIFGAPLIIGLTLLYLSSLLARRKHAAWAATGFVYAFVLGLNSAELLYFAAGHHIIEPRLVRNIILPAVVLVGLLLSRRQFSVRSDIQSFRRASFVSLIILAVAFIYGTTGFLLMDDHDFHQEIGLVEAMHHTVDQFDLTTSQPLRPYTYRSRIFLDSLSTISIGALAYALIALFQPLKARFIDQSHNRERLRTLLENYPAGSEDFFKLWPPDKIYYFSETGNSGLAFRVHRGVALVVGDPAGSAAEASELIERFSALCRGNDWTPAFIYVAAKYGELYEEHGFRLQKIGEEAVLDVDDFSKNTGTNKYFRNIRSKFNRQNFTAELLRPPHSQAVLDRLRVISRDWLSKPARAERGLMMGYFSSQYIQQCNVMVARDGQGIIQAFINQVPSFKEQEANFDLLRHVDKSPGNINDFLLLNFIDYLRAAGFKYLNLGLCPLAGLDNHSEEASLVDSALRFAYANGDRVYSFSGLHRFKAKYKPAWSPYYIAYRGGVRGFSRTLNALIRAMKVKA